MIIPSKSRGLIQEEEGIVYSDKEKEGLMHSVLEGKSEEGRLIRNAINHGIFSFNSDMIYQQMIRNYSLSKDIFKESFFQEYNERDLRLPEIRKKVKENIKKKLDLLKEEGLIDKDGGISEKGIEVGGLSLYIEELDKLSKGFGERINKKKSYYGDRNDVKNFKKDRYKDLAIRKSIKLAVRRGHKNLDKDDLRAFTREDKGKLNIIYALDASGSMKGNKLDMCKKAGVALMYNAINEMDKIGLIVFGSEVEDFIIPTNDFNLLLRKIVKIRAKKETNIKETILKAIEIFPQGESNHLVLVTDAIPTKGLRPREESLYAASIARHNGITISVIGINLDKEGRKLGLEISSIGEGSYKIVKNLEDLDEIILEDYYSL